MNTAKLHALAAALMMLAFLALRGEVPANAPGLPPGVSISASVNAEKVFLGDTVDYSITIRGNVSQDEMRPPSFSRVGGIEMVSGPTTSSRMTFVNGQSTVTRSWTFVLRTTGKGEVTIPPARINFRGHWYETNEVSLQIQDTGMIGISARTNNAQINQELRGKYFALAQIPDRVYEGQAVPIVINIYRDETLPSFVQWDRAMEATGKDFIIPGLTEGRQNLNWTPTELEGRDFVRAPLYTTYVVPTRSGRLKIEPPVTRIYFPLQRRGSPGIDDFFQFNTRSNLIAAECRIAPIELEVLPLPAKRSDSQGQVVGSTFVSAKVDREELPHRELLTLTLRVEGNAFLDTMSRPELPSIPHFTLVNSTSSGRSWMEAGRVLSEREFQYVLQAMNPGESRIPPLKMEVIDPSSGEVEVASTNEIPIRIRQAASGAILVGGTQASPNGESAAPERAAGRVLGRDVAYIDTTPLSAARVAPATAFYMTPWFWVAQVLIFLGTLGYGIVQVIRRNGTAESEATRLRRSRRAAEKALALAQEKIAAESKDEFYATLSRGMREFVATLIGRSAKGLTIEEAVEGVLRKGVGEETARRLGESLSHCDGVRYSPAPDTSEARETALANARKLLLQLDGEKR